MLSIAHLLSDTPDNVNVMIECPRCHERTASAVRFSSGLMAFNCKRATCGAKGHEMGSGFTMQYPDTPPTFVPNHLPMGYGVINNATVTELFSFAGDSMGHQTRTESKVIRTWMTMDRCPYHYEAPVDGLEYGFPLWLVEDIRSARTLAQRGQPAVALLGTQIKDRFISEELVPWLVRNNTPKILVALDPDATLLAMKQAAYLTRQLAYASLVTELKVPPHVQWVPIAMDIKDMQEHTIRDFILDYAKVNT